MGAESEDHWHGTLRHIKGGELSGDTTQTTGMRRFEAISGKSVGSDKLWMGETHVSPATASGDHHHGKAETAIYVVSGNPVFVFAEGEEEVRIETEPGTLLVLYTDGLIERRGEVITAGFDRLEAAAKAVAHRPLEEVCDDLLHQLGVDEARPDDVALMVVRLAPSSTAGVGGH